MKYGRFLSLTPPYMEATSSYAFLPYFHLYLVYDETRIDLSQYLAHIYRMCKTSFMCVGNCALSKIIADGNLLY